MAVGRVQVKVHRLGEPIYAKIGQILASFCHSKYLNYCLKKEQVVPITSMLIFNMHNDYQKHLCVNLLFVYLQKIIEKIRK